MQMFLKFCGYLILVSIVVSIPACHAGDRGSIPRRGELILLGIEKELYSYFPIGVLKSFLISFIIDFCHFNTKWYIKLFENFFQFWVKSFLPVGELNPGLPRDRRGYLPLY